jgi:hypothetical protein
VTLVTVMDQGGGQRRQQLGCAGTEASMGWTILWWGLAAWAVALAAYTLALWRAHHKRTARRRLEQGRGP